MASYLNIMIGGEAGQGVQSMGFALAKSFARGGYEVFADQDYESRVRGGHNFYRVRVSDSEIAAPDEEIDLLLALNKESIDLHRDEVKTSGVIVYDSGQVDDESGDNTLGVPLEKLTDEKIMANTVALGAALGLINYDLSILEGVLNDQYSEDIAVKNIKAAKAGFDYAGENYKGTFDVRLEGGCAREKKNAPERERSDCPWGNGCRLQVCLLLSYDAFDIYHGVYISQS